MELYWDTNATAPNAGQIASVLASTGNYPQLTAGYEPVRYLHCRTVLIEPERPSLLGKHKPDLWRSSKANKSGASWHEQNRRNRR